MGAPTDPLPVKLILGLIYSPQGSVREALSDMIERYGPLDEECEPFTFESTTYYEEEMGRGLMRRFVSFDYLIPMGLLPDIKLVTNAIEDRLVLQGTNRRTLNLDPGYLSAANLILATTKMYSHRPYLRDGIYAELTYIFRKGAFTPLDWTYPEYRDSRTMEFFTTVRDRYLDQLAQLRTAD